MPCCYSDFKGKFATVTVTVHVIVLQTVMIIITYCFIAQRYGMNTQNRWCIVCNITQYITAMSNSQGIAHKICIYRVYTSFTIVPSIDHLHIRRTMRHNILYHMIHKALV